MFTSGGGAISSWNLEPTDHDQVNALIVFGQTFRLCYCIFGLLYLYMVLLDIFLIILI